MGLIAVGTNYKYSSVELREKLFFSKKALKNAFSLLKEKSVIKGAVILSTCNRVEVYASVKEEYSGAEEIKSFISRYHAIDEEKLSPYLYTHSGIEALRHLFSVASGIDSLILGETQILGQVKASFIESERIGFIDDILKETFNFAVSFAGKMHTITGISVGRTSVGSVAIDFIKEKMTDLSDKFSAYISQKEGTFVIANPEKRIYRFDDKQLDVDDVVEIQIPYAMKLLWQEMTSLMIDFRIHTD